MERTYKKILGALIASVGITPLFAMDTSASTAEQNLFLYPRTGFFRFSFDEVNMPDGTDDMGLLGINYFADLTPEIYGGIGGYGSITGTQGGLFVLGVAGGIHKQLFPHWWGDVSFFAGGGGGRSSVVGGGLMLRPSIGLAYSWSLARLGLHYSYITFPSGKIHSQQIGADLDIPVDFYYVSAKDLGNALFEFKNIHLFDGKYLGFQRNDFSILLQAYDQKSGTKNVYGSVQDETMGIIGAELDHYLTDKVFWWVKAGGAFSGNTNGYMDVLGGLGYHYMPGLYSLALVPQLGIGAGGGGNVDTGGGVLINPQLGLEVPLSSSFAARVSGGYLWAPRGNFSAYTATGALIYHLDIATANPHHIDLSNAYHIQGWRVQVFNQTYFHPQRTVNSINSNINLIVVQIDQLFTPIFFFNYQAAFAYDGDHAGGYATGMIGPGLQTPTFLNHHIQLFAELLAGAGGGGNLALGGGALIEPVIGVHYAFSPALGLQASVGQLKAINHELNTSVFNLGFTIRFGTLNRET